MTKRLLPPYKPRPRALLACLGLVALIVALTLGFAAYQKARTTRRHTLTIGAPPLEQSALLYVAQARGFFEDQHLQVTISDYPTGIDTMNALLAGTVEIAEMAEFPFLRSVLQGEEPRILAVSDRFENDYLLVRTDRGIATPADLKDKRIGVIRGTILEFYLGRFLALNGVRLDEITLVDTGTVSRTITAMVSGELDAVVAFQPHVHTIQTQLGAGVDTWAVQNDQLVYCVLVADATWLDSHAPLVERLLAALAEAERYVAEHPTESQAIVRQRLGLDEGYLANTWPLHQFALSLDYSLIVALDDEARWLLDNELAPPQPLPDFLDYIYLEGLQAIMPEGVNIGQ